MPSPGRLGAVIAASIAVPLLGPAATAHAADTFQQCVDRAIDHNGEPPTCTQAPGGGWVASWPDSSTSSASGGFVFLIVLAVLGGIALLAWKVSTARRLASASGMDPGLATQMTLLSDDGLDATYLAASLRGRTETPVAPAPVPASSSATERLTELRRLLAAELITQEEYDARRSAIVDSL